MYDQTPSKKYADILGDSTTLYTHQLGAITSDINPIKLESPFSSNLYFSDHLYTRGLLVVIIIVFENDAFPLISPSLKYLILYSDSFLCLIGSVPFFPK